MRGFFASLVGLTALTIRGAHAQSFNVDIGLPTSTPSALYAGAAGQTGPWTSVGFAPTTPVPLVSTTGASTGVTLVCNGGGGVTSTAAIPFPAQANADLVALMADLYAPFGIGIGVWTFDGLAPGDYAITTYAYASDLGSQAWSLIDVPGSPDPATWCSTTWWTTANLQLGTTHVVHRVVVHPGAPVVIRAQPDQDGSVNGFQVTQVSLGDPFCAGDGIDATITTSCPCANFGEFGRGCASSVNPDGARLEAHGTTMPDTLTLFATGMPATATSSIVQGDARADQVFGDGLGCLGGNLVRIVTRPNFAGSNWYPTGVDFPNLSTRGQVIPGSGAVRHYQTFYRNSASFCTPATFNTTNARTIVW